MSNLDSNLNLTNDINQSTIIKESNELLKNSIETAIIPVEESSKNLTNTQLLSDSINSLPTPPITELNTIMNSIEETVPESTLSNQTEPIVMSESLENNGTIIGGDLDNVVGAGVAIDGNMSAEMEDSLAPPTVQTNGNSSNGTHDSPIVEKETLLSPVTPVEALAIAQSIPIELLPSLSSEPSPVSTPPVVEPPAPIGAPEILPPPPTQPLPTFPAPQVLPPTLQRVDSISSVLVEPPTPAATILIPPPTPIVSTPTYVASTPIAIQTPVASTSASPISIPSTTVSTPLPQASTSNLVQSYTTLPMEEDTIMSEVSDSPINKRSAEESVEEGQGEAKRARVEPEAYTFAAAPEPIISPPVPSPTPVYAAPAPTYASIPPPVAVAAPIPSSTIPASTFFAEATPVASTSAAPIPAPYTPAPLQAAPVPQQQYYQQPLPQEFPKQEVVASSLSAVAPNPYAAQVPVAYAAPIAAPVAPAPVGPEGPVAVLNKEQHKWALSLVRTLKKNRQAPPFLKPVDPVALLIPDYFRVVTKPMDLGTVETKLMSTGKAMALALKHGKIYGLDYSLGMGLWEGSTGCGEVYRTCQEFKEDVERVWENCFKYNGPKDKNPVSAMAGALQEVCEKMFLNSPYAPEIVYNPPPPVVVQPQVQQPVYVKPEVRRQSVSSSHRASIDSSAPRPKRETQVPARVADFDEAGIVKPPRQPKISGKAASEQLKFCKEVMKELFKKNHAAYAFVFYEPVDYMSLNIPQYPSIVKRPIDLGTIRNKLDAGQYPVPPFPAFEADMRLLFKNCYLFNPPGTPVHEWGKLVEGVFEAKWEERPLVADYEEESDDEQLHDLERQLATLQHSIATIKANKRAQKEERKAAERLARPPKAPKVPRQPHTNHPSDPNRHRNSTTNVAKRGRGSGGGVGHSVGPGRKRKNHKKDEWDSDQEDEVATSAPSTSKSQEVTFDMKRELAVKIVSFEGDALEKAIDIIRRGRPELLGDANKEIELDIDQLDQSTLLALYRYVCPAPKKPVNKRKSSNAPAPKRKSMDEMKESERIRDLEARLREFEGNANAGGGGNDRRGSNAGNGTGGGDQASSSSSSEGESESESEED